jgi:Ca-activated chloride channel family protein
MFNSKVFENSKADGVSVLEIVESGDSPRRFVPLKRTELRGEIVGPLASLTVTQTYRFSHKECKSVLEAVYRFPLPGDAAITGVKARFGDVEIVAELQEREKAEKGYEEAKAKGDQAALVTRESPDVFTLRLAGLAPDQEISVETRFVQLAKPDGAGWSLRVPFTTAPRYTRSDESNSRHAKGQPLMLLRDPGHRFSLDLTLPTGSEASSPTHSLRQSVADGKNRIQLEAGDVIPDRDCVLRWQAPQESDRPTFHVTTHDEPDHTYFLGLLAPPKRKPREAISREIILLVDHSGSMKGPKWEAADWAVKRFLGDLTEKDSFALGLFHDSTKWFAKQPQRADAKTITKAIGFLEANKDSGGTELGVALEQALALSRQSGEMARHVLLITDAEVSDSGRILQLADTEADESNCRRIDVLCIDAAPNSFLACELAERGGGVSKFLTSNPEEGDITTALDDILADWSQPVATGLRLQVNREGLESAGNVVKSNAIALGDLPASRSVWVAGRLPKGESELAFRVMTSADREVGTSRVKSSGSLPALKPLFGAKRVLGLEFLMNAGHQGKEFNDQLARLGYDPTEVLADTPKKKSKVYAENAREDAAIGLRRLLVRESLRYGLACSETAFLAVRKEAGKKVEATTLIPNALPHGWSDNFDAMAGGGMMLCSMMPSAPASARSVSFDALDDDTVESIDSMLCDFSASPSTAAKESLGVRGFFSKITKRKAGPAVAAPAQVPSKKADFGKVIFLGVPAFKNGEATLFDSAGKNELPADGTLQRLTLEYPDGEPDASALDDGLEILIFVDDLAQPVARVKLIDLLKQGGERPLNLRRRNGQTVRIVLTDTAGVWKGSAHRLKLSLRVS